MVSTTPAPDRTQERIGRRRPRLARPARPPLWFVYALLAVFVGALGIRLAVVAAVHVPSEPGYLVDYDPIFYHRQANLVADGRGFIAPYRLDDSGHGVVTPSAGHPPLLSIVLAAGSVVGLRSFRDHRAITALIGALVVLPVGFLAAWLAGWWAGIVAAALAAVYPNLWINDGMLMPEGLYALLVALMLLATYAVIVGWHRRASTVALGLCIGLAALTRGEGLLFLAFLVVPLAILAPLGSARRRLLVAGTAVAATAVVVLPWTLYNLTRFQHPVIISTAQDTTLAGANCKLAYYGSGLGYWGEQCFDDILARNLEESVAAQDMRSRALHYARHHVSRLPVVAAARFGREWGLVRPKQTVDADILENKPRSWSWVGYFSFFVVLAFGIAGAVRLWRRRVPIWPFVMTAVMVSVTAVVFYGNTRFRIPVEIAIVVLAAVAITPRRDVEPALELT